MKNTFTLFLLLFIISLNLYSQRVLVGVKGGLNFGFGAEIHGDAYSEFPGGTLKSVSKQGFHGGVYSEVRFDRWFIRAEGLYNTMKTEIPFPKRPAVYENDKLNIPLLFGYNVYGPIDVYLGPAYNNTRGAATLEGLETNGGDVLIANSYVSANLGVKVHYGRFEFDVRYEQNFTSNESYRIDIVQSAYGVNLGTFENRRVDQILISASFALFDSEYRPKKSRSRGCYF